MSNCSNVRSVHRVLFAMAVLLSSPSLSTMTAALHLSTNKAAATLTHRDGLVQLGARPSSSAYTRTLSMQASPTPNNNHNIPKVTTRLFSSMASTLPSIKNISLRRARNPSTTRTKTDIKIDWTSQNLAIALPALMGLLADPVLSMVDTGFVGRVGPLSLAALGVCTSIFHMSFTVFRASTVATTSLVGAASTTEEKRAITQVSLQFAAVLGIAMLAALRLGGPAMLATMGVGKTSPMYQPACEYLFARSWAAPAVVGIVVAEGAFRGNDDSKTPLIASSVAALTNLVLDPILMFPLGMGMAGAAAATAVSQVAAAAVFAWRIAKRKLLPQLIDSCSINKKAILKSIIGANLACLTKQGSMLVFYTLATALCTRLGPAHVATHQVCLSLFSLVTYWLDSGSISSQVLWGKNKNEPWKARSLTKYMVKYALIQGLAFSFLVAGVGKWVPTIFTQDATIQSMLRACLPHLALQQVMVSLCLVLEGLAMGGGQFASMAGGTALSTLAGIWQLSRASSVLDVWSAGVNTFFGCRLINAIVGVVRAHLQLRHTAGASAATTSSTHQQSITPQHVDGGLSHMAPALKIVVDGDDISIPSQ